MHCLGCGYNLKQLTDPRCPECGRGFAAADAQTWGSAKAFRFAKAARILGWVLSLTVVAPTLIVFYLIFRGEDFFLALFTPWVYAFVPAMILSGLWLGSSMASGRTPDLRVVSVLVICLVVNLSYLTSWPAQAAFLISRDDLNHVAQQALAGQSPALPTRAGVYPLRTASTSFTGNQPTAVTLGISPNTNGPDYLVYGMTDAEIEQSFNLWSYHRLDQDWHIVHED